MTELRIFELLQQIHSPGEETSIKFNEYSKLIPEHVDLISKFLANSIHESLKDNNTASSSSRTIDFIQLVRRWCISDNSHFNINEYNYECILDSFKKEDKKDELDSILCKLYGDFENLPSENVLDHLKDFYNKRDKKIIEKQARLEYINELDRIKLADKDFFTNKGHIKLDSIDNFLRSFLCDTLTENADKINEKESSKKILHLTRENKIKFVYALLNLKRNDNSNSLLKNTIGEIAAEETKTSDEIELARYLWNNKEIEVLQIDISSLFPFIYEVPIINICKELLDSQDEVERFNFIEKFKVDQKKLVERCKNLNDLRYKVINLINELFILSGYNEIILDVLKIFDT